MPKPLEYEPPTIIKELLTLSSTKKKLNLATEPTLGHVADYVGINRHTLYDNMRGNSMMSIDSALKLVDFFGLTEGVRAIKAIAMIRAIHTHYLEKQSGRQKKPKKKPTPQ